ncbi:DUF1003 domain-containing protein [Azospirillum picis]|uniref:Membrane protein n=1 Tax=Azospirillum picis TaxID=488438 RepID=A0ABU0MM34_9PROT|nr:DUF1003 domain-containing protein [Azospirillum picis]MBP2300477.1 putative membrane protein [Azospirillum picis]MDQ0534273.1 putative membrane protein [Azospirillum picis]
MTDHTLPPSGSPVPPQDGDDRVVPTPMPERAGMRHGGPDGDGTAEPDAEAEGGESGSILPSKRHPCAISGKRRPKRDLIALDALRPNLADRIRRDHPHLDPESLISRQELARYRSLYVAELLQAEHGELSELDREVAESLARHDTLAENPEEEYDDRRTLGERLSDGLASFGGSWAFLISFGLFLAVWMAVNVIEGEPRSFDPYPFILLNLLLSCLAAIQAPVIMMSQKRQEAKDRLRSENDYRVNLKAELEIRHLHEKMDYLIQRQWQRLTEIQQLQLEIMQEKRLRR